MSSALARYFGGMTQSSGSRSAVAAGKEAGYAVRQVSEGAVTAAALAYLTVKKGPEPVIAGHAVPVDLAVAAVGVAGGLLMADHDMAHDLRNVGTTALSIYTYRRVQDLLKNQGVTPAHGDACVGAEDPIIAAARLLV
jgi:hypothetical protein